MPEVAIGKHPDVGVMLGLYSYNAPRIAAEVAKVPEFRKKTTVVTFDLDEQAVEHLEKGNIDVSRLPEPLRDRLPAREAPEGPDHRRQGDGRGDVPQGGRPPSTPASG